jgi:pimeloyl-ACP methyl ester carboxylesterase
MTTSVMWDGVVEHLEHDSLAVDLPGRRYRPADLGTVTRGDWVRSVCDDVAGAGLDEVLLVGHSSAGLVIPGVAAQLGERVLGLVFVTANTPAEGQLPVESMRSDLSERTIGRHDLLVDRTSGRTLGGLRPGETPIVTDLEVIENGPGLGLEAPGPLFEPFTWDGFPTHLPRIYVRCTRDRLINLELADAMIANMGGARVIDIDAGHGVATSAPADLAALLDTEARRVTTTQEAER